MTTRAPTLVAIALLALAACSGSGDETVDGAASATGEQPGPTTPSASTMPPLPESPEPVAAEPDPADTFPTVPETGVPGLESEDDFCAAWSRFGGSWQVLIQVVAAGQREAVPRLEVVASPAVAEAFDELFRAWPSELESERDVVADAYFGAFQRRSADALQALNDAGAGDPDRDALSAAWVEALASYDPFSPPIVVVLTPEHETLVAAAVAEFESKRVGLLEDPTMVITAETPLTDQFLATACPDQGWIVGQET